MSLCDLQANADWNKVPRNDVQRQLDQLREQYRTALRNYQPEEALEELRKKIDMCETLLR